MELIINGVSRAVLVRAIPRNGVRSHQIPMRSHYFPPDPGKARSSPSFGPSSGCVKGGRPVNSFNKRAGGGGTMYLSSGIVRNSPLSRGAQRVLTISTLSARARRGND